ncbi:Nucleosome assembly protein 1-like 1 [Hordeum vulgare]|nr:Nucleosome assembly protein 1-like 1 [Hordeum vulgare]
MAVLFCGSELLSSQLAVSGHQVAVESQHDEFEATFFEERVALEAKYQKMYEPLYSKRHDVFNGVVEVEGVTKDDSGEAVADQKAKYMHSRLFAIVVIYVKYKAKCEAMKRINKE